MGNVDGGGLWWSSWCWRWWETGSGGGGGVGTWKAQPLTGGISGGCFLIPLLPLVLYLVSSLLLVETIRLSPLGLGGRGGRYFCASFSLCLDLVGRGDYCMIGDEASRVQVLVRKG